MQRLPYWDVLKFVAMLMVVLGHVMGHLKCDFGSPYMGNFFTGMNMPLFFMISGYFAVRTIEDGNWQKLGRHLIGYFWPLAVFSCVFSVLALVFHVKGFENGFVGYAGRWFLFGSWFIWCLAICFVVTFLCRRPVPGLRFYVVMGCVYLILMGLEGIWHMGNVRAMVPFFLVGAYVLRKWALWEIPRVGCVCLLLYFAGVVLQGDIHQNGLSFYTGDTTFVGIKADARNLILFIGRLVNGFVGSVGVMWLVFFALKRVKSIEVLAHFGTTTLGVYLLHQWILERLCLEGTMNGLIGFAWAIAISALLFLICHCFVRLSRSCRRCRLLLWGEW